MENANEHEVVTVPYLVYRDAVAHDRWVIKRVVIALIICIILMAASNAYWCYSWMQYDYISEETITTVDSEGDGFANYTGRDGGINYGEGDGA